MDWDEKAESYINENYELFAGGRLTRVLTRHVQAGIEAVRALRKENERLKGRIHCHRAETVKAEHELAAVSEIERGLRSKIERLEKENEELNARVYKMEGEWNDQQAKIERLEKECQGYDVEVITLSEKLAEMEKEKAELERVHGKLQHVFFKEVEIIERLYELLNKADSEIARLKRGDALLTKEKARNSFKMNDSLRYQLGDEVLKLFCEHGDYLKDD